MRFRTKPRIVLLLILAAVSPAQSIGQNLVPPASNKTPGPDLALGYAYLHGNAPPSGCGCFNMNGGSATFTWPLRSGRLALTGDATVAHAGAISNSGDNLTLSTFTAGLRYLAPIRHSSLRPFGEALIGLAHSSGTLVQGSNPGAANAGAAFAGNFGGGVDWRATTRFSLRLFQADYLITTFDNGSNNHQNNLRVSAGVVIQFEK